MLESITAPALKDMISSRKTPLALLDHDNFTHNLRLIGSRLTAAGKKLRLCTKSVRVPDLVHAILKEPFVNGLFAASSTEVLHFARNGVKDILLGYPTMSTVEIDELCEAASIDGTAITVMVDSTCHLDALQDVAGKCKVTLGILVDVDIADTFLGNKVGVYRSPLHAPETVVALAREIDTRENLVFKGIMGYEAQEAGIDDTSAFMRWIKARSRRHVNRLRQSVVDALDAAGYHPAIVNGGGSGCHVATAAEPTVTELGIGSLLFKPYLFDCFKILDEFKPSMFLAVRVARNPTDAMATAYSGGYISSGVRAPPVPVVPPGLKTVPRESFGEVQTPFIVPRGTELRPGDPVLCRFAKAGEPLEQFNEVLVVDGGTITGSMKTYRGMNLKCY